MVLKFYNTLTRELEEFIPVTKGEAKIYNCGPTVYAYAHIGNFRANICADLLRRYLEYKGFRIKQVMNITDVDDKTIRDSQKEKLSLKKFTDKYTKAFFEDQKALNMAEATVYPKATEHIKEMVKLVESLKEKGYTYESDGSIYFKISKFKDYGKLSKIKFEELKAGARVDSDEYEKEHANDFVLWKGYTDKDGKVFWETSLGKGRPGWHLECSAMSMKYNGETFDIHTGGIDLVFPHHENEIAQSEAATGKPFVNYWLHNEYLLVDGKKMSKSMGNFYTLRDLLKKGYKPMAIRYLLLSTHYRQPLNLTFEALDAAQNTLQRLLDFVIALKKYSKGKDNKDITTLINNAKADFEEEMDNDLNISAALGTLFDFIKDVNKLMSEKNMSKKDAKKILDFMYDIDNVLGVITVLESGQVVDKDIEKLIKEREKARKAKDYAKADKIRDQLKEKGIVLEDTPEGVVWKKV